MPPLPMGSQQRRQVPETPQVKRTKRMTMMEPPPNPANGEFVVLLQEAVLLEDLLDRLAKTQNIHVKRAMESVQVSS